MNKVNIVTFTDMYSGGSKTGEFETYIVYADNEDLGEQIFTALTGFDPYDISCTCCGSDFSVWLCDLDEYLERVVSLESPITTIEERCSAIVALHEGSTKILN